MLINNNSTLKIAKKITKIIYFLGYLGYAIIVFYSIHRRLYINETIS